MKVSIVGASGFAGGELLRLLTCHPEVEVRQVTSEHYAGKYVTLLHPNLRKRCSLRFCSLDDLEPCDMLFLALPHGEGLAHHSRFRGLAPRIIDLSADFRLKDPGAYPKWYGFEHPLPGILAESVYGVPELHREAIRDASLVCGAGCMAIATILGLAPIFRSALAARDEVIAEVKTGSSGAGRDASASSSHPERSGGIRPHKPTAHRHTAEIAQEVGVSGVHLTTTSVDSVRGVLATAHVFLKNGLKEKDLWQVYRDAYAEEPFVRIVKERRGLYRYPDPRILAGSNFCDIGFEIDEETNRLVVMSAIDNLMKGAAGNAVQCMNIMAGFPETRGLEFTGMHP